MVILWLASLALAIVSGKLCYPDYSIYEVDIRSHQGGAIVRDSSRQTIRIRYDYEGIDLSPSQEHYLRTTVVPAADHFIR